MRAPGWPSRRTIVVGMLLTMGAYLSVPFLLDYLSPDADDRQNKCTRSFGHLKWPRHGILLTLRFTDNGQLVDRCEQTDAFYELNWNHRFKDTQAANITPGTTLRPKFVVVYVHGWKNDARQDDGDYPKFKNLVDKLASDYKDRKQVVGIYVSWYARSWPVVDNLTFWSRMRAADRIAQSAAVTKFIAGLESILSRDVDKQNQLIVIGHSFGARMVYSATIQNLLHAVQREFPKDPKESYGIVRGSADAVILVNPAFEASLFTGVASIFRKDEQFRPDQPPVLVSISTRNDRATGWWFPIGQWVGWRTDLERTTLGYFADYQTHTLQQAKPLECFPSGEEVNSQLSRKSYLAGLCMRPLPRRDDQPTNPFLVAQTSSDVVDGHSDIWNEKFSDWLFQFVKALGEKHEEAPKSIGETKRE
jgi:pimeloyl-ACP methyl ester carboxylesterase